MIAESEVKAMLERAKFPWRTGSRVGINVYEGDVPMFQCHTPLDAERVVKALNDLPRLAEAYLELVKAFRHHVYEVGVGPLECQDCDKAETLYKELGGDPV